MRCTAAMALGLACSASLWAAASAPQAPSAPPVAAVRDRCGLSRFWSDDYRPVPSYQAQTRAPEPPHASRFTVQVVATGLVHPWSLAFLPDGRMLVTERAGQMRVVSANGVLSAPVQGLPPIEVVAGEGLHDVLLDRDFAHNRILYFTYFAPLSQGSSGPSAQAWLDWIALPAGQHEAKAYGHAVLARARLSEDATRLTDVVVILDGADRRIVQSKDGTLFVLAAAPAGGFAPVDDEPQRLSNTYGKVLHINADGSIPRNNPWRGSLDARPELFAIGQRDQEGATLHPRTGELWTVEHGPRGGDELNIVRRGRNYGFPIVSYGRNYDGTAIFGGRTTLKGMEQPVYFWTPSIAPSGLLFYTGKLFPEWRHSLFVGGLSSKRLVRLELSGTRVVSEEPMLVERCRRIRDVRQGPDGAVYVLTEEEDGELLRIVPRR